MANKVIYGDYKDYPIILENNFFTIKGWDFKVVLNSETISSSSFFVLYIQATGLIPSEKTQFGYSLLDVISLSP